MLCAFLVALVSDPMISLECPGRPLVEVIPKLAEQVHSKLYISKEVENLSVILRIRNKPWTEVKQRLAWAVHGSWVESTDTLTLTRTQVDRQKAADEQSKTIQAEWQRTLQDRMKSAGTWGAWTDADLRTFLNSEAGSDATNAQPESMLRTIPRQAAIQIAHVIGADTLSSMPADTYFADHPRPGEKPFPAGCRAILDTAYAAFARLKELSRGRMAPAMQAVMRPWDGHRLWTLYFADSQGLVTDREQVGVPEVLKPTAWKPIRREPLDLSPLAQEFAMVNNASVGAAPKPASSALTTILCDPVSVDPEQLIDGELFHKIAQVRNEDLVAVPFLGTGLYLLRRTQLPLSETGTIASFTRLNTIQSEDGWLTVRSNTIESPLPRAEMRSWVKGWRSANDSEALALRLWNDSLVSSGGTTLMLVTQRLLNRSLSLSGGDWGLDIWKSVDPMRPFQEVVTLTAEQRQSLWKGLQSRSLSLEQSIKEKDLPELFGEGGGEGTYVFNSGNQLQLLPLRALPNGIPARAKLTFTPAQGTTYLMGATDSVSAATRATPYSYGQVLRDLRSGAKTSGPKFFWPLATVGGELKLEFDGNLSLSSKLTAAATVLTEKGLPISKLPKSFLDEAEIAAKSSPDPIIVPPPKAR